MLTKRRSLAAVTGCLLLAGAPAAQADETTNDKKLRATYLKLYERAEKRGLEPGRNIVLDGVRSKGEARPAKRAEIKRSIRVLRRMTASGPVRRATVATPAAAAQGAAGAGAGLQAIAACESGGNPRAVSADGTYRGKYQFDMQTWQSVGGSGDPAAAPEAEQDRRAQALMAQRGSSPWPVCG